MERPSIVFLVNGPAGSAMGIRASSFAGCLADDFDIHLFYRSERKVQSIFDFLRQLTRVRPRLCYVFDIAFSGVLAAGFYRTISGCRMVVDTGDAIYELSRLSGSRGWLGLLATKLLEGYALRRSDRVVVRSHPHQELLASRGITADVIPDGVDTKQFFPSEEKEFRRTRNLDNSTVIGLLGSIIWNARYQTCYGWELLEALDKLRDWPVKGLIVGDGSGLAELKKRTAALRLDDRVVFAGRVPYEDLPHWINAMDICLSTQTNDIAGQVRTTGKLPLYLACGRFVLSTDVGEAARVLPAEMLVPYTGSRDPAYPNRLAERVETLLKEPERLRGRPDAVGLAQTYFDYSLLAGNLRSILRKLLCVKAGEPNEAFVSGGSQPQGESRR